MSVIVFGSINMDLTIVVPRLPKLGETIAGDKFFKAAGGKGANQAVAVAKLGFPVHFVGQVGGDEFGSILLGELLAAGVGTEGVKINPDIHSGIASIMVDNRGDNAIATAAGANGCVGTEDVERFRSLLELEAKVALLELGVPIETVVEAARVARECGVTVILDPAPAPPSLPEQLYPLIDIITPNEIEASQLVGFPVSDTETASRAASVLCQRGVNNAIVTLGDRGCVCSSRSETFIVEPIEVPVVDTVGAGDGFNGALAAALASGQSLRTALGWATVAGALSVNRRGAQPALPKWENFIDTLTRGKYLGK